MLTKTIIVDGEEHQVTICPPGRAETYEFRPASFDFIEQYETDSDDEEIFKIGLKSLKAELI